MTVNLGYFLVPGSLSFLLEMLQHLLDGLRVSCEFLFSAVVPEKLQVLKLVVSHLGPQKRRRPLRFPWRPSDDPLGIEIE
jgi:hypothetical protein